MLSEVTVSTPRVATSASVEMVMKGPDSPVEVSICYWPVITPAKLSGCTFIYYRYTFIFSLILSQTFVAQTTLALMSFDTTTMQTRRGCPFRSCCPCRLCCHHSLRRRHLCCWYLHNCVYNTQCVVLCWVRDIIVYLCLNILFITIYTANNGAFSGNICFLVNCFLSTIQSW